MCIEDAIIGTLVGGMLEGVEAKKYVYMWYLLRNVAR